MCSQGMYLLKEDLMIELQHDNYSNDNVISLWTEKKKPNKHWLPSNVKPKVSPHPNSVIQHLTLPLFMLYGFHFYQANQDVSLEDFNEQKKKAKLRLDSLKVNRFFFYYVTQQISRVVQYKEKRRFFSYRVDITKCLSDTNENPK